MDDTPDLGSPTGTDPFTPQARHLVVVSGGLGDPSSSLMLANRMATAAADHLSAEGIVPEVHVVEIRLLATEIAEATVNPSRSAALQAALDQVEQADGIVTVSPTFKASYSGLFKAFWDLVDNDALRGVPVLLGATGGTPRHSLMIDSAMRPLFSYLRTKVLSSSVFAAADDWGEVTGGQASARTTPLQHRIESAGEDLASVAGRLPARPRRAAGEVKPVEVIPFDQLLRGI
ncbi:CE1759 family FMN reductase [Citricoccus sp.]|uniref:CE1759 family FMN reductase n=1 Tax=Citricoccus sp. TaxID=1978372 RepID=UPI0028BE3092|nr:CE1759 family FMN reductase [Citricoccus sp.]